MTMTDREKLIELLNEASRILTETVGSFNDNHGNGMRADYLIANGVTVQKRGRWKQARYTEAPLYLCSECDKPEYKQHKYCPNCGAKMDLED